MSVDADNDLLLAYLNGELSAQQMEAVAARIKSDASFSRRLIMLAREDALLTELAHAAAQAGDVGFDAYHQWLGIRPKDQPANHYRLLAIELYENDPVVIENAADQRMAHLRTFSNSKHTELAQKLLNEVAAARVCLLRQASKQQYDEQLRAQLAQKKTKKERPAPDNARPAVAKAVAPPQPAVRIETGNTTSATERAGRNKSESRSWGMVAAVVAIAAVVLIAAFVLSRPEDPDVADAPPNQPASDSHTVRESKPPSMSNPSTASVKSNSPDREQPPQSNTPKPPIFVELNQIQAKLAQTLTGHVKPIRGLAYSSDGRLLASCSGASDGTIRLWDVESSQSVAELAGHEGHVSAVAFSSDGKLLASAGEDSTVRIWDVEKHALLHTLEGHTDAVETVAFAPSGKTIASGGKDETIRIWDVASAKSSAVWPSELGAVSGLAYLPDGKQLAVAAGREVELRDAGKGAVSRRLSGHRAPVRSLAVSRDGTTVVAGADDGAVRAWSLPSGNPRVAIDGQHSEPVFAVAISPSGDRLASGSGDKTVALWDLASGHRLGVIRGKSEQVYAVAFAPQSGRLAVGGKDTLVRTWEVASRPPASHVVTTAPPSSASASGEPVDLIAMFNPKRDIVKGNWRVEDGSLRAEGEKDKQSILKIPYEPPSEYDLKIIVYRKKQFQKGFSSLTVGMAASGQRLALSLGGGQGATGFAWLDGKSYADNETSYRRKLLDDDRPHTFVCKVRKSGLRLDCDGKTVIDWQGSLKRFSIQEGWNIPLEGMSLIFGSVTQFRIDQFEITPVGQTVASSSIDLLARVELPKHQLLGSWRKDGAALISSTDKPATLQLPIDVPEAYELTVEAQRIAGDDGFALFVVGGGRQFRVVFDSHGTTGNDVSGIDAIDGHLSASEENPTRRLGSVFDSGQPVTIRCVVRKGSVTAYRDGQPWVQYQGSFARLSILPDRPSPPANTLGLLAWDSEFRITRIEFRPLSAATPAPLSTPVDLLARVELPKHQLQGSWRKNGEALISPTDKPAMLQIPFEVPEEYELSVEAQRITGENGFWIFLAAENRQFMSVFDSIREGEKISFLQYVDGHHGSKAENPTRRTGPVFDSGKPVTLRCVVRKDSVVVFRNNELWVQHQGSLARLSLPPHHPAPSDVSLGLGSWESEYRITRIELRPLSGSIDPGQRVILAQRIPVPDAEAQKKALAEFESVFGKDVADAKKAEEKLALAAQFREHALSINDDSTTQFVLLRQSYDLALAAAGPDAVFQVVDDMAQRFQVDTWKARRTAYDSLAAKVRLPAERAALAERGLVMADLAAKESEFDHAAALAEQSLAIATRARNAELRRRAVELVKGFKERKKLWDDAQAAATVLAKNPDDAAANLAQGHYLCFVAGQWEKGLPHLVKSGKAALAAAAQTELAAADPKTQLSAADAWFAASEAAQGDEAQQYLDRACHWYRRCVDRLEGLDQARATKQLDKHDKKWQSATEGLVGHWKFDEGEGTVARDSVGNQHGRIGDKASWTRDGGRNVLKFIQEYNSYVRFSKKSFGPTFTVAVWVKTSAHSDRRPLVGRMNMTGVKSGWSLFYNSKLVSDRKVAFHSISSKGDAYTATPGEMLPPHRWTHVAVAVDQRAGWAKIYVNGREAQERKELASKFDANPTFDWAFGYCNMDKYYRYVGLAADLRVYNRALSAGAIANIMKVSTQDK